MKVWMDMAKVLGIVLLLGQFAFAESAEVALATDTLARHRLLKKLQTLKHYSAYGIKKAILTLRGK